MELHEFEPFGKIARLSRDCVITEKIDGTNAQISITDAGEMFIGSRTRWLSDKQDNHGFFKWATANKDELMKLGPGRHYGEWWGGSIQIGYGLKEKRFSLFNTSIWTAETKPACCHVVPILYAGPFTSAAVEEAIEGLRRGGSVAAPGCMHPEGVVIFHTHSGQYFKKTLLNDEIPKSLVAV